MGFLEEGTELGGKRGNCGPHNKDLKEILKSFMILYTHSTEGGQDVPHLKERFLGKYEGRIRGMVGQREIKPAWL